VYANWLANLSVVLGTLAAVVFSVLIHYEGLVIISRRLAVHRGHERVKVLYAIGSVLVLHVIEIWLMGVTYWLLLLWPENGSIGAQHLLDCVYFSAATYTTVGFGDLAPVGPIRFLAGTEALVGLVLITWSASFTYLEMERFWRRP
jgi:hypothetical protein